MHGTTSTSTSAEPKNRRQDVTNADDAIYLLDGSHGFVRVPSQKYESEDLLQQLIAEHPELLAGEQIDPDDPPRWLLVRREAGLPDSLGAADRWAVDHLLIDQNAIPTFVEVKRSTDPRIRREVVAQMLEYAANATSFLRVDRIRSLATQTCGSDDNLSAELRRVLALADSPDLEVAVNAYWRKLDDNLHEGRLRLLFVADELPRELRRLIEFLNEQMSHMEVLGIEVKQFHSAEHGLRALVPRLVGATERARTEKSPANGPQRKTNAAEFIAACPPWSRPVLEDLIRDAEARNITLSWGTKGFGLRGSRRSGTSVTMLYVYPAGTLGYREPMMEVYTKDLTDGESRNLRSAVLELDGVVPRGQYTLRLVVTEEHLDSARKLLPHIFRAYEHIGAN